MSITLRGIGSGRWGGRAQASARVLAGLVLAGAAAGCGSAAPSAPPAASAPATTTPAATTGSAPDAADDRCEQLYQQAAALEGQVSAAPGSLTRQAEAGRTACQETVAAGGSEREALESFNRAAIEVGDREN